MKLLLDENLSRRLVPALQAGLPGSSQVALLGLERATDAELCSYANRHGFVICSKDDDFTVWWQQVATGPGSCIWHSAT